MATDPSPAVRWSKRKTNVILVVTFTGGTPIQDKDCRPVLQTGGSIVVLLVV